LFRYFFDGVTSGKPEDVIVPKIVEQERMDFPKPIIDSDKGTKKDFTSERKSAVYLRQAINTAPNCGICGARVHIRSISIDHIQAKHDGGVAAVENSQLSHPFCNLVKDQIPGGIVIDATD
jgi:5-methylcytosine-specific restriction endonuclease McrA